MGLFDFLGAGRREKFANQVMSRLAERGWPHAISYEADRNRLRLGGEVIPVELAPISKALSDDRRKDRQAALDAALDFIFDLPPEAPFERLRDRLVPVLRNLKVTEAMVLEPSPDSTFRWDGAFQPYAGYYAVVVALELQGGLQPLMATAYRRWERSFDEVLEVALGNLRKKPPLELKRGPPGYFASDCADGNDLARLLLPETIKGLDAVKGEAVVVGASREAVFMADSAEPEALELMARWVPEFLDKHHLPVAFAPMVLRKGAWIPFTPPAELPGATALALLQKANDYEQEAKILFSRLYRTGRSEVISGFKLIWADNGPASISFWSSKAGLLPKTDFVVVEAAGRQLVRPWSDAADVLGLVEEPDTASPFYFATHEVDAAAIATLAATPEPSWAKERGFSESGSRLNVFG